MRIYSFPMQPLTKVRAEAIDVVASTFIYRTSRLMRLLASLGDRELSRTEAGLLVTLLNGPRRITELAETEALAQPTVTTLVESLQQRGLVTRERVPADRRVVLVSVSALGRGAVEASRTQLRAEMRITVEQLSNEELAQLVTASEILDRLIVSVRQRKASG